MSPFSPRRLIEGFYGGGLECHEAFGRGAGGSRLGSFNSALFGVGSYWASGRATKVCPVGDVVDWSVHMKPKQVEMDGILERIYNSLSTKKGERTLMVVCGDHGMNDVHPSRKRSNLGWKPWGFIHWRNFDRTLSNPLHL
jgi:hypothetical protein